VDRLTAVLGFMAALSVATERVTEVIKGFPLWSKWLALERHTPRMEEARKMVVHLIAMAVGTGLAWLSHEQLSDVIGVSYTGIAGSFVFGAMASGGSGLWNSALDILREVNKQKQIVTANMREPPKHRVAGSA
jgi:TRAP-type C4-dicarboxylate transport system permease small subunit